MLRFTHRRNRINTCFSRISYGDLTPPYYICFTSFCASKLTIFEIIIIKFNFQTRIATILTATCIYLKALHERAYMKIARGNCFCASQQMYTRVRFYFIPLVLMQIVRYKWESTNITRYTCDARVYGSHQTIVFLCIILFAFYSRKNTLRNIIVPILLNVQKNSLAELCEYVMSAGH